MRPAPARAYRPFRRAALSILLLPLLAACAPSDRQAGAEQPPAPTEIMQWGVPAPPGAALPDLVKAPDGTMLLSWVEQPAPKRYRLRLTRAETAPAVPAWQEPLTIGEGDDWFVNWADTPHVFGLADGSLWAHWLRSTGPERMDYGIELVRSRDAGRTWTPPLMIHPVHGPGDHGFVTFWPQARDRLGIAWLDSRQKATSATHKKPDGASDPHAHHSPGTMMLRAASYDGDLVRQGEWPLDKSTCDCCPTASAMTDAGVVVVYRGRTADEIRDTRIVRFDGERWSAPRDVHADGWKMPGCPVNGPVVVARGKTVWVAWFTMADGVPEVRAARSDDAGEHFGPAMTLAKGEHVLGRLSLALAPDMLLLASYETHPDGAQALLLGRYALDWRPRDRVEVTTLASSGRGSGIPRVQWSGSAAWLVWTDARDGKPFIAGASVR
ncbi:hypothetical protein EBB59_12485 [Lysobacter pythonis]|uniref:Exo-alpha-sialidase n=1 Tax=Solilutibacter pythonis TaxID=2483112 RepID=A0A3M2HLV0_9GAMM|nr:hypothetical protein EBB59_12485 [Lysobacter pythonis]